MPSIRVGNKKEELLKKVLPKPQAQAPRPGAGLPPPPQTSRVPGISGDLPLPTGQVVAGIRPDSLSPGERQALEAAGWEDGVPIPSNVADLLEGIRQDALRQSEEVVLPPGVRGAARPQIVAESEVPDDLKAKFRDTLKEAHDQERIRKEMMEREARQVSDVKGLSQAKELAKQALEVENDLPGKQAPQAQQQAQQAPQQSDTGAAVALERCPHCDWDLATADDTPEPEYDEKLEFLHAILGQRCYSKAYRVFGDAVTVTFRTLTAAELDAIYADAVHAAKQGSVKTPLDFQEKINRYRLALQIQAVRGNGLAHALPEGLSPKANPTANDFWEFEDGTEGTNGLHLIEQHVVENVLKTETLFRVVTNHCNKFNRLVAKMEAMADNSDFWKPTGAP
jgi:hypothetical protein